MFAESPQRSQRVFQSGHSNEENVEKHGNVPLTLPEPVIKKRLLTVYVGSQIFASMKQNMSKTALLNLNDFVI